MRDYLQGAFETLSSVKTLFEEKGARSQGCQTVPEKIDSMLSRTPRGAAVDLSLGIS